MRAALALTFPTSFRCDARNVVAELAGCSRFVDAATVACEASKRAGADWCAVIVHGETGPPVLAVDNHPDATDADRLGCLTLDNWIDSPVFGRLRRSLAGVVHDERELRDAASANGYSESARHVWFAPLLCPKGWFGTMFAGQAAPFDAARRELDLVATLLSIWCTDHGVGSIPDGICDLELGPQRRRAARLAARGCTNQEIADELAISINTVKAHLKQAFERLDVNNRTELAQVLRRQSPAEDVEIGITRRPTVTISRVRAAARPRRLSRI